LFVSAFEPVRYAALTDVGVKRSHNQDACAARPAVDATGFEAGGHVFVVADGMGGHAVGEKASAKAVQDIPHLYQKHAHEGVVPALQRAFAETNAGIHAIGQENPEFRGMGTTSTALILRPEGAWVAHVGDSRAYRIRDGVAEQLTFDHSWVWEIAKRQGVDPDELGDFKKNVIIRSLGPDPEVEVDIEGPHPVKPGDTFLLCSDGLTGLVSPTEIGAVVTAVPSDTAVRLLVHLANLRGGPDNITVMIVRVPGGPRDEPGAGRADRPGLLARGVAAWNRAVPWPFTAIAAGCGLALLSLAMHQAEITGAMLMFLVSAVAILAGVLGLFAQVRKEPELGPAAAHEQPRTLNVYKRHECAITPELAEKFAEVERSLAEGMTAQGVPVDWEAHRRLAAGAESPAPNPGGTPAFRARCESLLFLCEAFHKSRHKQEAFRPSWKSPDSSPGGSASPV
jgi:serine/threonine protein phosphatase PrpC